jgi:hypothetical protein
VSSPLLALKYLFQTLSLGLNSPSSDFFGKDNAGGLILFALTFDCSMLAVQSAIEVAMFDGADKEAALVFKGLVANLGTPKSLAGMVADAEGLLVMSLTALS